MQQYVGHGSVHIGFCRASAVSHTITWFFSLASWCPLPLLCYRYTHSWTPDHFHRRATIYSISTTHVLESDATSGNVHQKKKKKKACGTGWQFGRRGCILQLHKGSSLWSALFEPNWLLWLSAACNKTKNALMPDKAENVALRGWRHLLARAPEHLRLDRKPHAGCRPNSVFWEVHPVLPITPPHHRPFFIAVKGWIVSETEETQSTQCSAFFFFFLKKNKTFS